jgi:anti-sigma B factor antagonist
MNIASGRPVIVRQLPEKFSVQQGRIFLREIEPFLSSDRPRMVLDCSKVKQLDSAGIHALLCCLEEALKRNGDVKLAAIPPATAAILELTKVHRLFEMFESTAYAVDSFYRVPANVFQQALVPEYSIGTIGSAA